MREREERGVPEIYVGNEADFPEGDRKILVVDGHEVGVFRINGGFHAFYNHCPHQGGPVCQGKIIRKVEENLDLDQTSRGLKYSEDHVHIVCPWHGFEYDIETGEHPGDHNVKIRKCEVAVRGGEVFLVV